MNSSSEYLHFFTNQIRKKLKFDGIDSKKSKAAVVKKAVVKCSLLF